VTEVRHPIFAFVYEKLSAGAESAGAAEHRDTLLRGLSGTVVEVGAGHGLNFSHYPPAVEEVVAVEPEPRLRRGAEKAAAGATVPVRVIDAVADALPLEDASADAVVFSLVLCSVPDQAAALAEARRVLKPGGEVRVYEHVRARDPKHARTQDRVNRLWPRFSGGCNCNRDTRAALDAAGFDTSGVGDIAFKPGPGMGLVEPHLLGVAR
jgi:ubiquinone/menaquinone biosynthesis C-methylase UbiE